MSDRETLQVYAAQAEKYRDLVSTSARTDPLFATFMNALPPASHVLDLGCGPGHFAAAFGAAGHRVTATDASPEFVEMASGHENVVAQHATFDDIAGEALYDAVWANFSLLHAPRADMPRHLSALHRALQPGGLFHIGVKTGAGAKRDSLGRLYTYYDAAELTGLVETAGFTVTASTTGADPGLDGVLAPWIVLHAHA